MKFTAKTLYGLENVLARELEELGASDINPVNQVALERVEYSTQKPEALLERIKIK